MQKIQNFASNMKEMTKKRKRKRVPLVAPVTERVKM